MSAAILVVAVAALALSVVALVIARGAATLARRAVADDAQVRFTDVALIARGVRPDLPNESGTYEDPDLIVAAGNPTTPVPRTIRCPETYVVYGSWGARVANCQGFGGPADGNNHVVQTARGHAMRIAAQIPCDAPCDKRIEEIWKGWDCHAEAVGAIAIAAVELKIFCVLPVKP